MAVPTIVSASLNASSNSNKLAVVFSEPIAAADLTGISASIDGLDAPVLSQSVADSTIIYTLDAAALANQVVLFSASILNSITSVSTSDALAPVVDQAVVNNSYLSNYPLAFLVPTEVVITQALILDDVATKACQAAC